MSAKLEWRREERVLEARLSLPNGAGEVLVFKYGRPKEALIVVKPPPGGPIYNSHIMITRVIDPNGREAWLLQVYIKGYKYIVEYFKADKLEDAVAAALKLTSILAEHATEDALIEEVHYLIIAKTPKLKLLGPHEVRRLYYLPLTPVEASMAVHAVEQTIRDLAMQGD